MQGDPAALIDRLGKAPRMARNVREHAEIIEKRKRDWRTELAETQEDGGKPIHPARLLMELSRAAPENAIFVTDVGWNKNGAGQQLQSVHNASFITSGCSTRNSRQSRRSAQDWRSRPQGHRVGGDGGLMSVVGSLATAVELIFRCSGSCSTTLLLDHSVRRQHVFRKQIRDGVHAPGRHAVQPDFMLLAKSFGIDLRLSKSPRIWPRR
jgi:acetolactate synthase-1/2/3 large subunit